MGRIWEQIKKAVTFPDLRNKILVTILLLFICRFLAHIPLPGVDVETLKEFFSQNQIFGLLNMFSGGTMENFSIIMMGVAPYITASIVIQLLTKVVPSLEALSKEGDWGQRKMNQYTRLLTIPMAILQAYGMIRLLSSGNLSQVPITIQEFIGIKLIMALIVITGGTILLMWIGELISENGIGNGISLIITLGIVAGVPSMLRNTFALIGQGGFETGKMVGFVALILIFLAVTAFIIFINEGQRNIPVSYARRVRGPRMVGGVDTYLPMRVNLGGVIPIIFAMSLMLFPGTIARFFQNASSEWLKNAATYIANIFDGTGLIYGILYFLLVIGFTFFYTNINFNPTNVAENLQKQGGFIPGVRPGSETRNYIKKLLARINFIGGIFLGFIAVLPFIVQSITGITTIILGGTSVLIMVSVVLDTSRQIKSQFLMRSYNY